MEMHAFQSKDQFNTLRKFILKLADGTDTTEWLGVIGKFSETAIAARADYREALAMAAENKDRAASYEARLTYLAACCGDWSWAHPSDGNDATAILFTTSAVKEFLRSAPHLVDSLDAFIFDTASFFKAATI